jgi:hypothetical protein
MLFFRTDLKNSSRLGSLERSLATSVLKEMAAAEFQIEDQVLAHHVSAKIKSAPFHNHGAAYAAFHR